MLSSLDEGEEDPIMKRKRELGLLDGGEKVEDGQADKGDWKGVMWQDEVSGTKKVLSMDVSVHTGVVGIADFSDRIVLHVSTVPAEARAPVLLLVWIQIWQL